MYFEISLMIIVMQGHAFRENHSYYGADSHQLYNELKTVLFDHIIPNPRYVVINNREQQGFQWDTSEIEATVSRTISLQLSYRDTTVNGVDPEEDHGNRIIEINLVIHYDTPTKNSISVYGAGQSVLYFNLRHCAFANNKDLLSKTFKFFIDENQVSRHHAEANQERAQFEIDAWVQWFIDEYEYNQRQSTLEAFAMNDNPWAREFLYSQLMRYMPTVFDLPQRRPPNEADTGPYYQRYQDRLRRNAMIQTHP